MGRIQNLDVQIPHEIIQYWGWFLAFGIALPLLGVVAVVRSVTATIVSILFFGWLLVFASGVEIAQAVMVGHWVGFFHHLLAAILFGVTGLIFVTRPVLGAEVVTIFMAMFFLISGLFQLIGSALVGLPGCGLAGGGRSTSRLCWVYLFWRNGPHRDFWVIGLFIGIDLFFYGAAWIALALGLRVSS